MRSTAGYANRSDMKTDSARLGDLARRLLSEGARVRVLAPAAEHAGWPAGVKVLKPAPSGQMPLPDAVGPVTRTVPGERQDAEILMMRQWHRFSATTGRPAFTAAGTTPMGFGWYHIPMEAVVDQAGRIVLPKFIRDALGLLPGTKVDISPYGAGVQVVPAGRTARLVEEDGVLVAAGDTPVDDDVLFGLIDAGRK
jgi:AbrB family looped-hinge helix DNA binding protein